jgi:predicted nucleic acid-binding protein
MRFASGREAFALATRREDIDRRTARVTGRGAVVLYYIDTSALVKLVLVEPETRALRRFISDTPAAEFVTSALTRAELLRAALRRDRTTLELAREVLDGIAAITITHALLNSAGSLGPPTLRTLDAIHLATASELGADLTAVVAYDVRLLAAAAKCRMPTLSPS